MRAAYTTATCDALALRLADALDVPGGRFRVNAKGVDVRVKSALSRLPDRDRLISGKVTAGDIRQYVYDNADRLARGGVVCGWRSRLTGVAYLTVEQTRSAG
jgi:hypothetical protein